MLDGISQIYLFISGHNTILFEQSIAYIGILIYNKLPHEIKCYMYYEIQENDY
jgi:hypothetical protein